jgi:hypothetical protein
MAAQVGLNPAKNIHWMIWPSSAQAGDGYLFRT